MLVGLTRRLTLAAAAALLSFGPSRPLNAADSPLQLRSFAESFERSTRPKPKILPRRRMDMDFAVLLMRTSYQTADDLDFTPMDEFQRDFFLLRQDEWDVYRELLPRITQGDLSDPAYFDFISFCQYATMAASMRAGRMLFSELVDANGTSVIVNRDPALADNALLPGVLYERVGATVLDKLCEKYRAIAPAVPPVASATTLTEGVKRIATIFEINDYHLTSRLTTLTDGFELALVAPATLWSQQVLRRRGDLHNDFEAMVVQAYLRQCSVPATYTTSVTGTEVIHRWKWPSNLIL